MDVTLQNIFLLISENQLVKDQRKYTVEHVQEISSVIKYVTSLLTQLSHSVCGLFFLTVVCCGI